MCCRSSCRASCHASIPCCRRHQQRYSDLAAPASHSHRCTLAQTGTGWQLPSHSLSAFSEGRRIAMPPLFAATALPGSAHAAWLPLFGPLACVPDIQVLAERKPVFSLASMFARECAPAHSSPLPLAAACAHQGHPAQDRPLCRGGPVCGAQQPTGALAGWLVGWVLQVPVLCTSHGTVVCTLKLTVSFTLHECVYGFLPSASHALIIV
jgi:hypothetical protein